ncbi:hypothetical protein MtrunA17_Chr3g0145931 [Medicago truncatula]|uniref:Uncharacterized protein n=1 Tax=Medicago truncatula TaxID=3880 RepID=G7J990_MEDTR|nr:hypothetical protein MTR_3g118310 [Medicago truncatula]RHN71409.1 hypothetical protein MtrunA17_Chr3g0145931 [Medicago truncatula]
MYLKTKKIIPLSLVLPPSTTYVDLCKNGRVTDTIGDNDVSFGDQNFFISNSKICHMCTKQHFESTLECQVRRALPCFIEPTQHLGLLPTSFHFDLNHQKHQYQPELLNHSHFSLYIGSLGLLPTSFHFDLNHQKHQDQPELLNHSHFSLYIGSLIERKLFTPSKFTPETTGPSL